MKVIDDVRRTRAVVLARKHDLYGLEAPQSSQGLFRVLDVLSGAHTAGSALNGVLMKSRSRLTEPFLEFIRTEYVPVYDRKAETDPADDLVLRQERHRLAL